VIDQLVDRELERGALESHLAEATAGRGLIVLLAGEAGVGKSMLARAVLGDSDVIVLESFGAREGTTAYGPLVSALRLLLRSRLVVTPIEPVGCTNTISLQIRGSAKGLYRTPHSP
jgi:hypothetical protein